ncbi:hypothetical protein BJN34_32010 [Cupriavidus necator]|uniref:Lipoprotein n=1 Tax=Cupriavidus necator TaxID=106590 RepID=A0A1U9V0N8_CUPNE|nr:hypothetical protein [Cupriavidus necator]AQV98502.1 hypothetical protein BJN34_32010 [Cupriavidus necator]
MKRQTTYRAATWATAALTASLLMACGGGDNTDPSSTQAPAPSPGSQQQQTAFINWTNSANGEVVKDFANQNFKVQAIDGTVVDATGTKLNTAIVNTTTGALTVNGQAAGKIAPAESESGTQIAAFFCTDGSGLVWSIDASTRKYSFSCMSSVNGQTSVASGSGTTTKASGTQSFITWTGSVNGDVVLDASSDQFKVRTDGALLLQGTTVLNGAMVQANGGALTINGDAVGAVKLQPGSSGGQVAVLVCTSGGRMDISTNGATYTYSCPTSSPSSGSGGSVPEVRSSFSDVVCNGTQCVTNVTNTGTAKILCTVDWHYQFVQDLKLQNGQTTTSAVISPGSTRQMEFDLGGTAFHFVSAYEACQKSAF